MIGKMCGGYECPAMAFSRGLRSAADFRTSGNAIDGFFYPRPFWLGGRTNWVVGWLSSARFSSVPCLFPLVCEEIDQVTLPE